MTNPENPTPDPERVGNLPDIKRIAVEGIHFYFIYLPTEQLMLNADPEEKKKLCRL